jgi:hypothetical protein
MNPTNDIHDIKGLVPVPHGWWWLWALLAVAAIGIALWLWRRRKPTAATATIAPPTASEIALAALQRLRQENPPVEEFYTWLSDIVRQYIEGQFGLHAPERTTEEFLVEASLRAEHMALLGAFLQESDLVKFARHRPGADDMARAYGAAEKFVRDTQT